MTSLTRLAASLVAVVAASAAFSWPVLPSSAAPRGRPPSGLDPALRTALSRARAQAAADGVSIVVTSGWRSRAEQQRLLDDAVAQYGSLEEALRWVASPDTSAHVSGDAVDVGDGRAWLAAHGAAYGLCQVYANEPWHFELRAVDGACPALLPDASELQR